MNERQNALALDQDTEQTIAAYLRAYPDFFTRHLELLESLRIPHSCRPAQSLLERQIALLREQNSQLREKLHELLGVARDNECLSKRMQSLTLGLIEATDLDEMLLTIQCVLRDEFNADFIALRLAARPLQNDSMLEREFASAQDLQMFAKLLLADRPFCGRLTAEQTLSLFDDAAPCIASVALVPLRGSDWSGLLAIGSMDQSRFHSGIGTVFLTRIGELISHALQPYLRAPCQKLG